MIIKGDIYGIELTELLEMSYTFNNFELGNLSEEEINRKPDEPIFRVGGKKLKKKAEKSIFCLVGPDLITLQISLTKKYTECRPTEYEMLRK